MSREAHQEVTKSCLPCQIYDRNIAKVVSPLKLNIMYVYLQLSPGGVLDEETVGRGLSNLGRSAEGTKHVYLHCTVPVSKNKVNPFEIEKV